MVRDKKVHEEVIEMVTNHALSLGFIVKGLEHSPIRGPEGNIEYLLYIEKDTNRTDNVCDITGEEKSKAEEIFSEKYEKLAQETVEQAHLKLDI